MVEIGARAIVIANTSDSEVALRNFFDNHIDREAFEARWNLSRDLIDVLPLIHADFDDDLSAVLFIRIDIKYMRYRLEFRRMALDDSIGLIRFRRVSIIVVSACPRANCGTANISAIVVSPTAILRNFTCIYLSLG